MKPGIWELLIVLAIALLIFGPKALPKLGSAMGKTIGNFKKGLAEDEDEQKEKANKAEASDKKSDDNGEE
jgi:sec-independent protein translocase protein TatA